MTVFRELVTKIGFKVDKTGLDSFEKTIVGFKTKFALAATAVTAFAAKTLGYFDDLAKGVRTTEDLSAQTQIATERFVALRRAAQSFQLDPNVFDSAFKRLAVLLEEAKSGYGELFEIQNRSRGQLNLRPFIETGDVESAFKAILNYVDSIEQIGPKIAALEDIFGNGTSGGFLRIVNAGTEAFERATEANLAYGQSYVDNIPKTKEYEKNVTEFYQGLESATVAFVENVLPIVTKTLNFISEGFKGFGVIKEQFQSSGFVKTADFVGQAIADSVYDLLGYESLSSVQRRVAEEDYEFNKRLNDYYKNQALQGNNVTVNNKVDVAVAPGTTAEQANNLAVEVNLAMQRFWDEQKREILSNSPQVE
jgi:hypothetical protein